MRGLSEEEIPGACVVHATGIQPSIQSSSGRHAVRGSRGFLRALMLSVRRPRGEVLKRARQLSAPFRFILQASR